MRTSRAVQLGYLVEVKCGDRTRGRTCGDTVAELYPSMRVMARDSGTGEWMEWTAIAGAVGEILAWCPRHRRTMPLDIEILRQWAERAGRAKRQLIVWAMKGTDGRYIVAEQPKAV